MDVVAIYEKYKGLFIFAIGLFLGGLFLYFFIHSGVQLPFLQRAVAHITAFFLNNMGLETQVYETVVKSYEPLNLFGFTVYYVNGKYFYLSKEPRQVPYPYSPATLVINNTFFVDIVKECTGVLGFLLIATLILFYPRSSWKNKLFGIALGFVYEFFINVVRVVTTVYFGYLYGNFEFIHTVLWRVFSVVFTLVYWIVWLKYFSDGDNKKKEQ